MPQAPASVLDSHIPAPEWTPSSWAGGLEGFSSAHKIEAVINELVKLNPRIKPNSTTVLLLLRHLRSTAKCADNGVRLVARYKKLYGDEVNDGRVRLQLAGFAIKQNNPTVFRRVLASASAPGGFRWDGVALARRRARLMRERASWVYHARSDERVWMAIRTIHGRINECLCAP